MPTVFKVDKRTIKASDKIRRGMLWACKESISGGGGCKVNWSMVYRPNALGGLGILDLGKLARALLVLVLVGGPSQAVGGHRNSN
jgi:hypothetical protein